MVGRAGGQAYGHVIIKFFRMGRLLHFFTYGAPMRKLRAQELRYNSETFKFRLHYPVQHE